jgi:hypothetical protein
MTKIFNNIDGQGKRVRITPSGVSKTDMTAEQISAKEAKKTARIQRLADEEAAATEKTNNQASGKTKLKAGEALNDAEVSALFGD